MRPRGIRSAWAHADAVVEAPRKIKRLGFTFCPAALVARLDERLPPCANRAGLARHCLVNAGKAELGLAEAGPDMVRICR